MLAALQIYGQKEGNKWLEEQQNEHDNYDPSQGKQPQLWRVEGVEVKRSGQFLAWESGERLLQEYVTHGEPLSLLSTETRFVTKQDWGEVDFNFDKTAFDF